MCARAPSRLQVCKAGCVTRPPRGGADVVFCEIKVGIWAFSLGNTVLRASSTALGVRLALLDFVEVVFSVFHPFCPELEGEG